MGRVVQIGQRFCCSVGSLVTFAVQGQVPCIEFDAPICGILLI